MSRAGKNARLRHRIGATAGSLPAVRCDRAGCRELIVPADEFTTGQLVSWRADGSPGPTDRIIGRCRRRIRMSELVARLRR